MASPFKLYKSSGLNFFFWRLFFPLFHLVLNICLLKAQNHGLHVIQICQNRVIKYAVVFNCSFVIITHLFHFTCGLGLNAVGMYLQLCWWVTI